MFVIPHTNEQQIFLPVTHTTYMWPLISWKCIRPPFFNPLSQVNYFTYKFIVRFMVRDWFGLNFCVPLLALSTCPWLARGQPVPDLLLDTCVAMLWCCLYVCMWVYLEYTRKSSQTFSPIKNMRFRYQSHTASGYILLLSQYYHFIANIHLFS